MSINSAAPPNAKQAVFTDLGSKPIVSPNGYQTRGDESQSE
jgi:hypothetical protein